MKMIKTFMLAGLLATLIVACTPSGEPLTSSEIVEKKAVAWLQAMVDAKWDETYQFTSPGYRSGVSEMQHTIKMASRRVRWLGGQLLTTECDGDVCSVDMRVVFSVNAPVRGVTEFKGFQVVHKNWVNLDGKWWLVPGR